MLQLSDSIDDMGIVSWQLACLLALSWIIIFLVLLRGVESLGKVYVVIWNDFSFKTQDIQSSLQTFILTLFLDISLHLVISSLVDPTGAPGTDNHPPLPSGILILSFPFFGKKFAK